MSKNIVLSLILFETFEVYSEVFEFVKCSSTYTDSANMALVPVAAGAGEVFEALTPAQKTLVVAKAYDEAKSLVSGGYRAASRLASLPRRRKQRRVRRRRARRRRRNAFAPARNGSNMNRSISSAPTMMAATAMTTTMRQSYSRMLRAYKVTHREYIRDINGSVGFGLLRLPINVGKTSTFPWLARIALNFEQYKFTRLRFSLKTQAPTTVPGSVILAIDYDPTDPDPLSKADMLQYEGATRAAPWNDCTVIATPKNMARLPKYYVSPSEPQNTADLRLQDVGNLFIATQGQSDASVVSELWVEYEVDLITPQSVNRCMQQQITVTDTAYEDPISADISSLSSMGPILGWTNGTVGFVARISGTFFVHSRLLLDQVITSVDLGATSLFVNGNPFFNDYGPFLSGAGTRVTHYFVVTLQEGDTLELVWDNPAATTYSYVLDLFESDAAVIPPVN
jgi:hypothetical protein